MNQLTTKNAEANFLALQRQITELAENCSKLVITDPSSLLIATQQYSMLKAVLKNIESIRVVEKAPFLDACKQIDALAKKMSAPGELVLSEGEKKLLAYNKAEHQKAVAEQNRINAIKSDMSKYTRDAIAVINASKTIEELTQARTEWVIEFPSDKWSEFEEDATRIKTTLNDLCIAKRIELQTPAQADETISETITEAIVEQVAEVGSQEIAQAEFTTTSKLKGTWRFEVVDESKLPREYLMPNEKAIKDFMKHRKDNEGLSDGLVITGIRFFIEESVTIR